MEFISQACNLEGEPLSGKSIQNIVSSYSDGSTLASEILKSDDDFTTKFIVNHESYITIRSINMRVCHNLTKEASDIRDIKYFIHGLGGNLEQFEPLLRQTDLEKKHFVVIDLPGFGKSEASRDSSMLSIVDILKEALDQILDSYKISKDQLNLDIIGHSMGCYLTIHFFQKFYKTYSINMLVFLAPPNAKLPQLRKGYSLTQFGLGFLSIFPGVFDIYRTRFDQSKGLRSSGINNFFYNRNHEEDNTLLYRKLWQFHNNVQIKSSSIVAYLQGWEQIDWSSVNEIIKSQSDVEKQVKVLIIGGTEDKITPIEGIKQVFNAFPQMKNKKMEQLQKCSHNMCFDSPEETCKIFSIDVLRMD